MCRMYLHMTRVEDANNDVDVIYRTLNLMADEERYIYFISDLPHVAVLKILWRVDVPEACGITAISLRGIIFPNCFTTTWRVVST